MKTLPPPPAMMKGCLLYTSDLGVEGIPIKAADLPKAFDIAAEVLGKWINECFILEKPLPEPTTLENLNLTPDQKGLWIEIVEA